MAGRDKKKAPTNGNWKRLKQRRNTRRK